MPPTQPMRVLCIIVNYKDAHSTQRTIDSLACMKHNAIPDIIVVDNECSEESLMQLRADNPSIEVKGSFQNLGFAGGVNLAVQSARSCHYDYYWLLNNDAVADPHCLEALLEAAIASGAAITGSSIYYMDQTDKIWAAGGTVHRPLYVVQHNRSAELENTDKEQSTLTVDFVNGCSMLLESSMFHALQGFDDTLFLYGEDVDYCERAKEKGGTICLAPRSKVFHAVSASTGGEGNPLKEYYLIRNGLLLIQRFVPHLWKRIIAYLVRAPWDFYRMQKLTTQSTLSPFQAIRLWSDAYRHGMKGVKGRVQLSKSFRASPLEHSLRAPVAPGSETISPLPQAHIPKR